MNYIAFSDDVLVLLVLFVGCQVISWLMLQVAVIWLATGAAKEVKE